MIKTTLKFIWLVFNILAVWYLISPTPVIKDLPDSVKSTLPGDTTQLKNVAGYYTNLSRTEVMNFYRSFYSGPLLIRLNHPPETAKTIFRDTMQSYYLEELILPFRESLFINGYEWEKDVFTKPDKRITNKLIYDDVTYAVKITIRTFPVPILNRLFAFFFSQTIIILIILIYRRAFKKHD